MKRFEGEVKDLIETCVKMSHYHSGIDYEDSFELTFFEKQLITKFINDEMEKESERQIAMMKAMGRMR